MPILSRAGVVVAGSLLLVSCGRENLPVPPFAEVTIVNSNAADVLVLDCPVCQPGGVGIPGSPNANPGGGGSSGWTVNTPGPLTYTVTIKGRRVVCRPPKPPTSRPPTTGPGPVYQLTYDITKDGRCVVLRW
jgi:hypothetical protein